MSTTEQENLRFPDLWYSKQQIPNPDEAWKEVVGLKGFLRSNAGEQISAIVRLQFLSIIVGGGEAGLVTLGNLLSGSDLPINVFAAVPFIATSSLALVHHTRNVLQGGNFLSKDLGLLTQTGLYEKHGNVSKIFHPEWQENPPSKDERETFYKAVYALPPIGAKIPLILKENNKTAKMVSLAPFLTAEQQVGFINELRQKRKLGNIYIHQMTVQGRLSDEFKYVALALTLNSPHKMNWEKPFYKAPWGEVAPLVHDGGVTNTSLNPFWRSPGRTDYLQRIALVREPDLEQLEQLNLVELLKLPTEKITTAQLEQEERGRLLLEAKAYQRLALTLHARNRSTPLIVTNSGRKRLAEHFDLFRQKIDTLLRDYDIHDAASIPWFRPTARLLPEWNHEWRYEADWLPIQQQLIRLEEIRHKHPDLRSQVKNILQETTTAVDDVIGLSPRQSKS